MRRFTEIIAMAITLVAMLVLLAGNAYGQSDENTVDFWCETGVKLEPVDTPFVVPTPPEGTTWTRLVLKVGVEHHDILNPNVGTAYSHPSGKEISHVILCYTIIMDTPSTSTTTPTTSSTTTTDPASTTSSSTPTPTAPTTSTSTAPPTTEQRYLCEGGEVVAIGPDHEHWEGASLHAGDPICEPPVGGVPAGGGSTAAYSQFPAVEIAVGLGAWLLASALTGVAWAMYRRNR